MARKVRVDMIEFSEQFAVGLFVGLLGGGEAGAVYAVVDRRVDARVPAVYVRAQCSRVEIQRVAGKAVEGRPEQADDFRGLVVDDAAGVRVPQYRNGDAPRVIRAGGRVHLAHEAEAVGPVTATALGLVEGPAILQHDRADDRHADMRLQFLQRAHDEGAVRPGAGEGDIQVIAARLGWVRAASLHALAKLCVLADEASAGLAGVVPAVMPCAVDEQSHTVVPPRVASHRERQRLNSTR